MRIRLMNVKLVDQKCMLSRRSWHAQGELSIKRCAIRIITTYDTHSKINAGTHKAVREFMESKPHVP